MSSRHRISIRTRITLFAGAVAALLCSLVAVLLMIAIERFVTGSLTGEIIAAGGRVAVEVERGQLEYPLAQRPGRNLQVVDSQGRVVASTPELQGKPAMATFTTDGTNIADSVVCGGVFPAGECNIVIAQRAHRAGQSWIVYSASPVVPPWVDPRLAAAIGGGALILAVIITYFGSRIVTASLRPVSTIRAKLDEINATYPENRVPVPPSNDEIHELADSVNFTLTRLQASMEQQRQFAADASHELRTPIAGLRAQLEEARLHPGETDLNELIEQSLSDVDRLQAIITDLLLLARLGHAAPELRERADLAALVRMELARRGNPDRVRLVVRSDVPVDVSHGQIGRVITNLLDNAERHARQSITVEVWANGDQAELVVDDDGEGVAEVHREMIFERFTRLDAARSRDRGGTGLGLAIARAVAQAHNGTIEVGSSAAGGARFTLRLPLATSR
ncbi:sensor histidine kinase, partial [Streptosporangium lutulentum]